MQKIKAILISHGEKIGFGLIGLLALLVVAVGTSWSWYPKYPQEFVNEVDRNRDLLLASTWPVEEQERFADETDMREAAEHVLDPMEIAAIAYPNEDGFVWPVIPRDKPADEPAWLPVRALVADAGRAILALGPHPDTVEDLDLERAELARVQAVKIDETNLDGPTPRDDAAAGIDGNDFDPSLDAGFDPVTGEPIGPETGELYGTSVANAENLSEDKYRPFVAVRGIFPLKEQLEALRDAMGLGTLAVAYENLVFLDFELERQQAVAGPDAWTGPWEPVDIEVARDVLIRSTTFDADTTKAAASEAVFTMPLPGRLSGSWGFRASHPAFSEESVDARRAQIEAWLTQKLLEYEKAHAEELKQFDDFRQGGFSTVQSGTGEIRQSAGLNKQLIRDIVGELQQDLPRGLDLEVTPAMVEQMLDQEQSELLFRYIDFDVRPGNLYRYRVRLKLFNPNFGRPVDTIRDASVARGKNRFSDWSEPTDPTFVEPDTEYFIADVDGRDDRFIPSATIPVYDWHADHGTPLRGEFRVEPGGTIGGVTRTQVIDVALGTATAAEIEIDSGELLVDVVGSPERLDRKHREVLGIEPREFDLPEVLLVVDEFGDLGVRGFQEDIDRRRAVEATRKEWLAAYKVEEEEMDGDDPDNPDAQF
ncbi:MAG: hypothetical protein AAF532_11255 [Planctomycetota bacterium]